PSVRWSPPPPPRGPVAWLPSGAAVRSACRRPAGAGRTSWHWDRRADQAEVALMPMREAGQGVGAIAAVAGEDELPVGEPMDQDGQQLPHQLRRGLVLRLAGLSLAASASLGSGLGLVLD